MFSGKAAPGYDMAKRIIALINAVSQVINNDVTVRQHLRVLFVQAAWVVLIKPMSWERHGLRSWIEAAKKRLHRNVAIAMGNSGDLAYAPKLHEWADGEDPVLAEAAQWALDRLEE